MIEEYRQALKDVIYLTACAVNGNTPNRSRVDIMDLTLLYQAARRHLLTAALASALESTGVQDTQFQQAKAKAMRKNAILDADRNTLFQKLEEAKIWYMSLKGSVLKGLYPGYGMRQMADNDILFDASRAGDVKDIMVELGFAVEHFDSGNHDIYHKPPVSNFELHRSLFGIAHDDKLYRYYKDVKSRLVKDEGKQYGFHFTDEDFYLYMVAHEYKHYSISGTGLRSLLDTYVYLQKKTALDFSYIGEEAERLGITDYERKNRALALHLFGGGELTDGEREMLDYMLASGTYGTVENSVRNQLNRYGRWGFLRRRAFLPLKSMKTLYPVLEYAPALMPVCWVARWGKALVFSRNSVKIQVGEAMKYKSLR